MNCPICDKPVPRSLRGAPAKYCSQGCRDKGDKAWRKAYDAQPHVVARRAERVMNKYYWHHPKAMAAHMEREAEKERKRLRKNELERKRYHRLRHEPGANCC